MWCQQESILNISLKLHSAHLSTHLSSTSTSTRNRFPKTLKDCTPAFVNTWTSQMCYVRESEVVLWQSIEERHNDGQSARVLISCTHMTCVRHQFTCRWQASLSRTVCLPGVKNAIGATVFLNGNRLLQSLWTSLCPSYSIPKLLVTRLGLFYLMKSKARWSL